MRNDNNHATTKWGRTAGCGTNTFFLLSLYFTAISLRVSVFPCWRPLVNHYLYGCVDPWVLAVVSGGHIGLCNGRSYFLPSDTWPRRGVEGLPAAPYLRLLDYIPFGLNDGEGDITNNTKTLKNLKVRLLLIPRGLGVKRRAAIPGEVRGEVPRAGVTR